ncbi:MAG: glutamate racemase [Gallionellales bacterium RIFCSPLOWO2_02_FULL_57_47]|nr:MAG: glutamate racemase [Gallionellales bacterium RIFCSPLOWO2_02_FULL_57_47]
MNATSSPANPPENPIGVFDSGVGGLSVLREIRRELPGEDLLYVADSGHAPYGDKSSDMIETRSIAIVEFLLSRHAKAIVVACNTATGAAVEALRARFPVPIIAMEPAVKPAAASTKSGVIGVLATSGTLSSSNFAKLHERFGAEVDILVQACPGLVEQVEAGDLSGDKTRALIEKYLVPLLAQQADTLVLGCTHYPFLAPLIQEIAGPAVAIIDPAAAIARELRRRLASANLLSAGSRAGTERFWTSAAPDKAQPVIAQLWKEDIELLSLPNSD